jgi:hypothetical protein
MKFVVCVNKEGLGDLSGEDVTVGHAFETVCDADQHGMIRIIDQRGENYLYPVDCFEAVTLSDGAEYRLHDTLARMSA